MPSLGHHKKIARIVAIAAAGAVIATISLAYAMDQNNRYGEVPCCEEDNTPSSDNSASSLVVGFTALEEIVANSDAIVIADVDRCAKVHSHPKAKEIRLTDIEVTIEKSITGNLRSSETVSVQLVTSGEDAEDHLMQAGERYVLFLTFNQITSSYVPVGGPQGRFVIVDDLVYSLDSIYPNLGYINVKVDGQPLDDFLSEVESTTK